MPAPSSSESQWREHLRGLADWSAPHCHTTVIAPHPDDETLGAGGLIATLCALHVPVSVVAVTDGEAAYENQPALGRVRRGEQEAALARLGVSPDQIHRLGIRDSAVARSEDELAASLRRLVPPGSHLVAPWVGDFHPDHEACGRAAQAVARSNGHRLTYWLFWTWVHGSTELLGGLDFVRLPLSAAALEQKRQALSCHASQLDCPGGKPILGPEVLGSVSRSFEAFVRS